MKIFCSPESTRPLHQQNQSFQKSSSDFSIPKQTSPQDPPLASAQSDTMGARVLASHTNASVVALSTREDEHAKVAPPASLWSTDFDSTLASL